LLRRLSVLLCVMYNLLFVFVGWNLRCYVSSRVWGVRAIGMLENLIGFSFVHFVVYWWGY